MATAGGKVSRKLKPGDLARTKESGRAWEDRPAATHTFQAGGRDWWLEAGDVVLVIDPEEGDKNGIVRVLHSGKKLIMWDDELEKLGDK
jgi:hypothetical protein